MLCVRLWYQLCIQWVDKKELKNEKFEAEIIEVDGGNNKNTISVFRFPKDENERERWVKIIRQVIANLKVTNETVICEKHWPKSFEKIKVFTKYWPKNPLSLWEGIPRSQGPKESVKIRTTKRTYSCVRNRQEEELTLIAEKDKTTFKVIHDELVGNVCKRFVTPVAVFKANSAVYIESQQFF